MSKSPSNLTQSDSFANFNYLTPAKSNMYIVLIDPLIQNKNAIEDINDNSKLYAPVLSNSLSPSLSAYKLQVPNQFCLSNLPNQSSCNPLTTNNSVNRNDVFQLIVSLKTFINFSKLQFLR